MTRSIVNVSFAFSTGFLILFLALDTCQRIPERVKGQFALSLVRFTRNIQSRFLLFHVFGVFGGSKLPREQVNTPKARDKSLPTPTPDTAKLVASRRQ